MPLAPPPTNKIFATYEDLFQFVQSHAAREGYAVNAKAYSKDKNTGIYRRRVIRCDRSGKWKPSSQAGIRRTSSKKTGCPFSATASIRADGCYLAVLHPEHNHPPSVPGAHVQHRKLTDAQRQIVEAGARQGKITKVIHEELKALDPNTHTTCKDIENFIHRLRRNAKEAATGVQAIMYKLTERQDLECFTLEKGTEVHGAFWVPRWCAELWMRNSGTPDILVMMTENVVNQPVLPILEMNSVLNTAGLPSAPPANARSTTANNTTNNNNISHSSSGNGLDASIGAGYAILPDKSDATILWLMSAVEKLRARLPQCPKPRFITMTDFHTAEKNMIVEVSKGGVAHRQMHIVFGRVLTPEEPVRHGVRTRRPRQERSIGNRGGEGEGGDDDNEGTEEGQEGRNNDDDDDDDDEDGEEEEEEDQEDQNMEEDHEDSDSEIARQLMGPARPHGDNHYHGNRHGQTRNPGSGYDALGSQQHQPHPSLLSPLLLQQPQQHRQQQVYQQRQPQTQSTRPDPNRHPHPTQFPSAPYTATRSGNRGL